MKKLSTFVLVLALQIAAHAQQMVHFYIGSVTGRNEVARSIKYQPDGSCVIAGYIYDLDSQHRIINADNLLFKVRPDGTIVWQKQWGTAGNDMLFDMTIAANGQIIVVGTADANVAGGNNTAAIYRIKNSDGSILASNFIRDNTTPSAAGDRFASVCELANGRIVAVGGHNYTPVSVDGFVSVFSPSLANMYNEVMPVSAAQSDHFTGVVADGNSVYIVGPQYTPASTTLYDMTLMRYTPGAVNGVINWTRSFEMSYFDAANAVTLNSDWPQKIFMRGNYLMVTGILMDAFLPNADRHFIFRYDIAAATASSKVMNSGSAPSLFSNSSMIYPLSDEDLFSTEEPDAVAYNYDIAGVPVVPNTDIYISHVSTFTTSTISQSTRFQLATNESVQSIDYHQVPGVVPYVYLAGNAAIANDNDVYFSMMHASLIGPSTATCPITVNPALIDVTPVADSLSPANPVFASITALAIDSTDPGLSGTVQCGTVFAHRSAGATNPAPATANGLLVPNPAKDYVSLDGMQTGTYVVLNMLGVKVLSGTIHEGHTDIDVSGLPKGLYVVRATAEGSSHSYKFVKQ